MRHFHSLKIFFVSLKTVGMPQNKSYVMKAVSFVTLSLFLAGCSSLGDFKPGKPHDPDTPTTDGLITGEKGQLEYDL